MISTVTTTTVSTLTALGVTAALGVFAIIALLVLMMVKEMAGSGVNARQRLLAKTLNVGIVPLMLVFALVVVTKVVEIIT